MGVREERPCVLDDAVLAARLESREVAGVVAELLAVDDHAFQPLDPGVHRQAGGQHAVHPPWDLPRRPVGPVPVPKVVALHGRPGPPRRPEDPRRRLAATRPGRGARRGRRRAARPDRPHRPPAGLALRPRDEFAVDLRDLEGQDLAEAEIDDRRYDEFLLDVELVQAEQIGVLRCLIAHHGLKRVFCEGLTPETAGDYGEMIVALRAMEEGPIPGVRRQLEAVRTMAADSSGGDGEARAIEAKLAEMLAEHRERLLAVGAAGRLLIAGELEDVLPLEEAGVLAAADPLSPGGGVAIERAAGDARHDAMMRAVLSRGPVGVTVLGGGHDLTESVRRAGGDCEYLWVTTGRYEALDP